MKKRVMYITLIVLAAVIMGGCSQIIGLVFEPNLYIDFIDVLTFNEDWAGITVGFRNDGVWQNDVGFGVYFSDDPFIDENDFRAYEDWFSIGFNGDESITIQRAYMNLSGLAAGDYYIGVIVDHYNEIDESDDRDNTYELNDMLYVGGDGGSGGIAPDEWEPDNGTAEYQWVGTAGLPWQYHNFHEGTDEDWFFVDFSGGTMMYHLVIETRPAAGNPLPVGVRVEIRDQFNSSIVLDSTSSGDPNTYLSYYEAAGPFNYWVRVSPSAPDTTGEYEILISYNPM